MLLVPLFDGSRIANWTEQATRSHAVYRYSTPEVCVRIYKQTSTVALPWSNS